MMIVRPIQRDDHEQLVQLAQQATFGLTTLPKDPQFLNKRILASERSFAYPADEAGGESYLFVLEDLRTGRLAGTCGIVAKVGGFDPFYAYRVETVVHESKSLKVRKEINVLHLVADHNGPTEIGSLFLAPEYRRGGNGRLLSVSRFLFMALHPQRFESTVIAEMRGVIDEQGGSVLWDALGRHFFDIDFPTADYLSVVDKRFIADLMPRHPIYIPLLPQAAQEVIGQVHPQTRPALKILETEGFRLNGMVDIFEGGPVVSCPREEIRAVRDSAEATVAKIEDEPIDSPPFAVCTVAEPFRVCAAAVKRLSEDTVQLNEQAAMALGVTIGARVRLVALRAPTAEAATGSVAAGTQAHLTPALSPFRGQSGGEGEETGATGSLPAGASTTAGSKSSAPGQLPPASGVEAMPAPVAPQPEVPEVRS